MSSCSNRLARVLSDVRQDIDHFLDPAVLSLIDNNAKAAAAMAEAKASLVEPATEELKLEVLGLRGEGDTMLARLEESRHDLEASKQKAERRASHDAAELARLHQRRDELERDGRAKKRRAQEAECEALQLRSHSTSLEAEAESLRSELDQLREDTEAEHRRHAEEIRRYKEELSEARAQSSGVAPSAPSEVPTGESEALREQVGALQDEIASLRRLLEQVEPDRQLAAHLRQRHAEYEDELKGLRVDKSEFAKLRSQALRLEQEEAKLRAALEARSNALLEAEDAAHEARLAKRDLAAFIAASAEIVSGSKSEGSQAGFDMEPTSGDLNLAWARIQGEVSSLRRKNTECQQNSDWAVLREQQAQSDLEQIRSTLSEKDALLEERQIDLRRARDEVATLSAKIDVLKSALSRHSPGEASAAYQAVSASEELKARLESEIRRCKDLQAADHAKQRVVDSLTADLVSLRKEFCRMNEVEVKNRQLQRASDDLRRTNSDLESERDRLASELQAARQTQPLDYDPSTTKVLHFRHGPGASFPSKGGHEETIASLRDEVRRLRAQGGSAAVGDLENRQAARQLERFKKATKKYVQDFREGTYGLLGWKVEMKGDGSMMKWHLTSSFQDGQELVFQLRPGEGGSTPKFDLLSTPWAEQLQADRHAMAYLEVYRSIPGFLAHITADLLSRQTIPS